MAMNLASITENASRLGMRITERVSERTRDLAVTRGSSSQYLDASDEAFKNLARQLDSNSDREKLDAMKRLIALISKGRDVSEHFAQVVKNVASQNLEIRKLVYIYLLRYAEQEPDLALLSINTFQKDLSDSNPLIRAMALRVLSGIKVPMVANLVVVAVKKCAADISPYVRKAAALAIPKCYELDPTQAPELINTLTSLLRDRSPLSLGSVAAAFEAVCPTRLDLLHKQYRRFCKILVDVDEWGQFNLLGLLLRYVRTMLARPKTTAQGGADTEVPDPDLQLLLISAEPLLQSRNPAVVVAVVRVFYYAGPSSLLLKTINPLLRLLHLSQAVQRVVLSYLITLSESVPNMLSPYYSRFLIHADDVAQVKKDKVRLLLKIINVENHQAILREFIDCANDIDDQLVACSIQAIGKCAQLVPDCASQCLSALLVLFESRYDVVVSNTILVLRSFIQNKSHSTAASSATSVIPRFAYSIEDIRHPQAKACALWLVGQYSADSNLESVGGPDGVVNWAPDVLRKCAKSFGNEAPAVRLQIITLAAKLLVLAPVDRTLGLLSQYVFSMARYDLDYDIRDRARTLSALLANVSPYLKDQNTTEQERIVLRKEQVQLVLFHGKADIVEINQETEDEQDQLGSFAVIASENVAMTLPDWLEHGVDPLLRHSPEDQPPPAPAISATMAQRSLGSSKVGTPVVLTPTEGSSPAGSTSRWTDLDKFYEESDNEDSDVDSDTVNKQGRQDGVEEFDGSEQESEDEST